MIDERIYELEDGTELVLIESIIIKEKRYLLLNDKNSEKIIIAFEENGNLNYINQEEEKYQEIVDLLYQKFNSKIRRIINVDK